MGREGDPAEALISLIREKIRAGNMTRIQLRALDEGRGARHLAFGAALGTDENRIHYIENAVVKGRDARAVSAIIAEIISADLLVYATVVKGIYDRDPWGHRFRPSTLAQQTCQRKQPPRGGSGGLGL